MTKPDFTFVGYCPINRHIYCEADPEKKKIPFYCGDKLDGSALVIAKLALGMTTPQLAYVDLLILETSK